MPEPDDGEHDDHTQARREECRAEQQTAHVGIARHAGLNAATFDRFGGGRFGSERPLRRTGADASMVAVAGLLPGCCRAAAGLLPGCRRTGAGRPSALFSMGGARLYAERGEIRASAIGWRTRGGAPGGGALRCRKGAAVRMGGMSHLWPNARYVP